MGWWWQWGRERDAGVDDASAAGFRMRQPTNPISTRQQSIDGAVKGKGSIIKVENLWCHSITSVPYRQVGGNHVIGTTSFGRNVANGAGQPECLIDGFVHAGRATSDVSFFALEGCYIRHLCSCSRSMMNGFHLRAKSKPAVRSTTTQEEVVTGVGFSQFFSG